MKSGHRKGLGSGIAGSDARKFDVEDRVGAVRKDHRGDVERSPRLRPQGWQRIHRPAVAVETDDLPVRTGNRGARCDWNALPDRAAGQRKMIVRLDTGRKSMNAAACGCAFVGNDSAARKIMSDDLSGRQRIERSDRDVRLARYANVQRLLGCLYSVGESLQGGRAILVSVGEIENSAILRRTPGRLIRICEEAYWGARADQDQLLCPFHEFDDLLSEIGNACDVHTSGTSLATWGERVAEDPRAGRSSDTARTRQS